MGEARKKRKLIESLLIKSPNCIFCGGSEAAVTVDHVPPIAMFDGRQRPKGLEFPACEVCNNGTTKADLIASMIGRVYPSPTTQLQKDEFRKLLTSVNNNVQGVLEEMNIGRGGQKLAMKQLPSDFGGGVFRIGPIINKHMEVFSLKIGLALHFHESGNVLPKNGGVATSWFTNFDKFVGEFPTEIVDEFPEARTLAAGKKTVLDQFEYASRLSSDKSYGVYFAGFRQSFAIFAAVSSDAKIVSRKKPGTPWDVVSPTEFKKRVVSL